MANMPGLYSDALQGIHPGFTGSIKDVPENYPVDYFSRIFEIDPVTGEAHLRSYLRSAPPDDRLMRQKFMDLVRDRWQRRTLKSAPIGTYVIPPQSIENQLREHWEYFRPDMPYDPYNEHVVRYLGRIPGIHRGFNATIKDVPPDYPPPPPYGVEGF